MALSKAKLVQTLALISLLLLMLAASKVHSTNFNRLPEGYVVFGYPYFNPQPEDLIYTGDAHVVPGSTSLRLTNPDQTRSHGAVFYSNPVLFWKPGTSKKATFITIMMVNITPPATNLPPDGLTFLILPFSDVVGEKLGIFDSSSSSSGTSRSSSSSINITVVNGDNPDPNHRYVRININPAARRKSTSDHDDDDDDDNMLLAGEEVTLEISYVAETTTLSVGATSGSKTFHESIVFDLMSILPPRVLVGVQASTVDDAAALFELNLWFFYSRLPFDKNKRENDKDTYIKQYV